MAIGYACVHIGSEATKLSTLRLANATADNIHNVIEKNLAALLAMLEYNADHEIRLFRISSDIIPLASHPAMTEDWRSKHGETLTLLGKYCRNHAIRVSMHPGQYTVLNSPNAEVVQRASEDLRYHSDFLDALGCDSTCKIVIHTGGVYGDKKQAMLRFIKHYSALDERIKARLVIENDDRSYTAEDVLLISQQTGMPVVFDYLHHILNPSQSDLSPFAWIDVCGRTWREKDGRQKVHYSQSAPGAARGAHTKTIDTRAFMSFFEGLHDPTIDLMLEVKDKNLSVVKCILLTKDTISIRDLEEEWARYKYLVLSRSASIYKQIRTLLQNKSKPDARRFYTYIDEALALPDDEKGAQVNALQHMWGYVGNNASVKDREKFASLLAAYQQGMTSGKSLKTLVYRLAKEQKKRYLLESLYFYV